MGSAFQQLCPRYSGTQNPTAPTAIRLWRTCTFTSCLGWSRSSSGCFVEAKVFASCSLLKVSKLRCPRWFLFISLVQQVSRTSPQSVAHPFQHKRYSPLYDYDALLSFLIYNFLELPTEVVILSRCWCINLYDGDINLFLFFCHSIYY